MVPRLAGALAAAALALSPAPAAAQSPPPDGATWTSTYITTKDGERLHTDVMRPEGATDADETPVILVVSPYLGETNGKGPVPRFFDFFEGARVFERGYSVVQVSTRGTGGSSGCLDILGPGEQEDVRAAVEWAAKQPWSTGKVGMYGKSYDANLGMAGAATEPPGLAAVVAQQVGVDRYRGSYNGRVRLLQSLVYPSVTYGTIAEGSDAEPGLGSPEFERNRRANSADCQVGLRDHYGDDPTSAFWKARDLDDMADGSRVPVLMTGGYLDNATNIGGGTVEFFQNLDGPKRLWLGWWAHDRGNDEVEGRLAMGREGWFDEVMRWYDAHLKGRTELIEEDPPVVAQTSDGTWYEASSFPPPSVREAPFALRAGSYPDDARNDGSAATNVGAGGAARSGQRGRGAWTIGAPLERRTQLAGVPRAEVVLGGTVLPRTNVVVNLYDVDPQGRATYLTRGASLADAAGAVKLPLWPTDWVFEAGHRIGVLVSGANMDNYVHVPTGQTVAVTGGTVTLPLLPSPPGPTTQGESNPRLEAFRTRAPFPVPASAMAAAARR